MYNANITEIGSFVNDLLAENMLVLFGPTAPAELRDICAVHDGAVAAEPPIVAGGSLDIDDQHYTIVKFGDAANTNLAGLGHLTVVFNESGELLPGSVLVTPSVTPKISVGTKISFSS